MTAVETGNDTAKLTSVRGAADVPHDDNSKLPKSVRDHLPEYAQTIYREAFSDAWVQCAHDPAHEEIPHRVAWSAVPRKYCKPATAGVLKG